MNIEQFVRENIVFKTSTELDGIPAQDYVSVEGFVRVPFITSEVQKSEFTEHTCRLFKFYRYTAASGQYPNPNLIGAMQHEVISSLVNEIQMALDLKEVHTEENEAIPIFGLYSGGIKLCELEFTYCFKKEA